MENQEEIILLIDQYLADEMSEEERKAFEKRLASDEELKQQFDTQVELYDAIKELQVDNKRREMLTEIAEKRRQESLKEAKVKPLIQRVYPWAVAAAIITLLLLVFVPKQNPNSSTADQLAANPKTEIPERIGGVFQTTLGNNVDSVMEVLSSMFTIPTDNPDTLIKAITLIEEAQASDPGGDNSLRLGVLHSMILAIQGKHEQAKNELIQMRERGYTECDPVEIELFFILYDAEDLEGLRAFRENWGKPGGCQELFSYQKNSGEDVAFINTYFKQNQ
ncbi:MAG: hypothetical protein AAGC85_27005 [Bacteroidota bacterium]